MKRSDFQAIFYTSLLEYPMYKAMGFNEICSSINEIYDISNGHSLSEEEAKTILKIHQKAIKDYLNFLERPAD